MYVQVKVLDSRVEDNNWFPTYATSGSVGLDLHACIDEPIVITKDQTYLIPTGIAINMPDTPMAAMLYPRSGLGHKQGLVLGNGTGVIDTDYQGQLMVSICKRSFGEYTIEPGERIAQLVFTPIIKPILDVVEEFTSETQRGVGGFGSTGKS